MSSLNYTALISVPFDTPFRAKEPISALTHLIAFAIAVFSTPALLIHALISGATRGDLFSLAIFMISMVFLYAASTLFHALDISPQANKLLQKFDHMMIFVLIAGTYTPICTIAIGGTTGTWLLTLVWGIAFAGLILKACWVSSPKWFSSVIYIGMGWVCVLAMPQILASLATKSFLWLFIGGVLYTTGGVIYSLKLRTLEQRFPGFGEHELFHLFVMAGSFCHFMTMWGL